MITPDTYEEAMTQAEAACTAYLAGILELEVGKDMTIGIDNGQDHGGVFDIGQISVGATTTFNAGAMAYSATLKVYHRDRAQLQKWIMRLIHALPTNGQYSKASPLREQSGVCQLRIVPDSGSIGKLVPATVNVKASGKDLSVWSCLVKFDVVFVIRDDIEGIEA